jgi:hypothetical protein
MRLGLFVLFEGVESLVSWYSRGTATALGCFIVYKVSSPYYPEIAYGRLAKELTLPWL